MSAFHRPLGKKQTEDNAYWASVWGRIETVVSEQHIRQLVERTAREIEQVTRGKRVGYAWSGGKDSQALRIPCEIAGIDLCVLGMNNLEYLEFLQWITDEMPWQLTVINTGQDLEWLSKNPDMLFPQDSKTSAKWFRILQHKAQRVFYKQENLDMIILGRRHQDGNYTGKDGTGFYTNAQGVTRYSPIRFWTHEEVMAACYYYEYPLPPIYDWPNGWVVGTGCWAARQWTGSIRNAWSEVHRIDPDIAELAAPLISSAAEFLAYKKEVQEKLANL